MNNEVTVGHESLADSDDVNAVVARLRSTFATGRTRSYAWRKSQLIALDRLMTENWPAIAKAIEQDVRRHPMETSIADYYTVIGDIAHARRHLRSWMSRKRVGGLPLEHRPASAWTEPEPYGTVLIIGPWNFPIALTLDPLVAALAAGNTVILKPSELAPSSSALMAELVPKYLDSDSIAVIEGDGAITQELISCGLDKLFFTGGTEVGRKILAGAAPHLTPAALELGGKSPVYVSSDANLETAAKRIAYTKRYNAGQICIAPDYILAEQSIRDELVRLIGEAWRLFDPVKRSLLPIVNQRQFDRLSNILSSTKAEVVFGGQVDRNTLSIEPTIVLDPELDDPVMNQELFGPILPVLSVTGEQQAIEIINSQPKPLTCYIFTKSSARAKAFISAVPSGSAAVNQLLFQFTCPTLPFGGVGESGIGAYHGKAGFEEFSHRKSVFQRRAWWDLAFIFPPYDSSKISLLRGIMDAKYRLIRFRLRLFRK
ncbi:aldehyde dehydrogenase family protein [Mycolicibacterium fortuitum]|uniref:aldehyde dehydrogenase family protein n=1 Tax=Mycolicibacterium fortuitum TaxID=1766 RepID=UPI003AF93746